MMGRRANEPMDRQAVGGSAVVVVVVVVVIADIESPSNHQKIAQNPLFLRLLTSKCASRHNGVHFLDVESPWNRQKVVRI